MSRTLLFFLLRFLLLPLTAAAFTYAFLHGSSPSTTPTETDTHTHTNTYTNLRIPVPPTFDKALQGEPALYMPGDNPLHWESVQGEVRLNGLPFHIKGVNFFGFETDTRVFHGLDKHSMEEYFDFVRAEGFNLMRVPISLAAALDLDSLPKYHWFKDPRLRGKTVRQLLEIAIDEAGKRGILILLDMHRALENEKFELWYTDTHTYTDLLQGWDNLLYAFGQKWNVMGVDLLNEPHGQATWETGNPSTDWNKAAQDMIIKMIHTHTHFQGLFFVAGVSNDEPYRSFWGENLEGVGRAPINVWGNNHRVVYTPHVYGPSVDSTYPYFYESNYPQNMPVIWDALFGFVEGATGRAVVVGEWGGMYKGETKKFMDEFALYMLDRCLSDNIFWVLNPNSADTGGLLANDWTTPKHERLKVLRTVQPFPSRLFFDGEMYVFNPGQYANGLCDPSWPLHTHTHMHELSEEEVVWIDRKGVWVKERVGGVKNMRGEEEAMVAEWEKEEGLEGGEGEEEGENSAELW